MIIKDKIRKINKENVIICGIFCIVLSNCFRYDRDF